MTVLYTVKKKNKKFHIVHIEQLSTVLGHSGRPPEELNLIFEARSLPMAVKWYCIKIANLATERVTQKHAYDMNQ
jgi:hypothetical protein